VSGAKGETHSPIPKTRALRRAAAFTLIELLVVMAIIIILAGLVLGISSYAFDKGRRSRAETEIAAMSAALESYKADNGIYPQQAASTDLLDSRTNSDPSTYKSASLYLYSELSGLDTSQQPVTNKKSYFTFKAQMQGHPSGSTTTIAYVSDPWGNSYGYSTAQAAAPGGAAGFNPTFDLWSTAGPTPSPAPSPPQVRWIKNW
jgi:general secretion pathway protein G